MERKCRISGAPAAGEGISHLFGIYRSRTPDIKKSRLIRIRFIFVPVILGSLLLVIFLTIIDVSKSNAKPLPFARLSHLYSNDLADSGREQYTNVNKDENIRSHVHKNITETNLDSTGYSTPGNSELNDGTLPCNRTRLHQIQSTVELPNSRLTAQENIFYNLEKTTDLQTTETSFNDFTFDNNHGSSKDGKTDRRGRGYFDSVRRRFSGAENSAVELQNNKRQMLRTPRIMSNPRPTTRLNKFYDSANIGNQYVNPPFTVTPMYSNMFAQLGPYQSLKNIKSIGDVLKYVVKQNPSNVYVTNTVTPESVPVKKAVKFTGTYKMPVEDNWSGSSFGGRLNQKDFKGFSSSYPQSYVPFHDPFRNFKPVNPSEINKLISTGTNADTIPSFSNNVYFTEPSSKFNFAFGTTPNPLFKADNRYNNQSHHYTSGSQTIAIFKPLEPTSSYGLGFTTQMPAEITNRRTKPFSVTLDIYPMTVGRDLVTSGNSPQSSYQLSPPNKDRPPHPRWKQRPIGPMRGPRFRKPSGVHSHDSDGPDNHMIVHLNLFPNRSKQQSRHGRGRGINKSVLNSVIAGGTFGHRSLDGNTPVGDYVDYDDINSSLGSNDTSDKESNEFYLTTVKGSDSADAEVLKTVSYDFLRRGDETQDSENSERGNENSDVSDEQDYRKESTTGISDAETTTEEYNSVA